MTKTQSMTLEFAEAQWALGLLHADSLPEVACAALEAGLYSEPLCVLAGLVRPTARDAGPLFEQALVELGRVPLTHAQGLLQVAGYWARRIVSGAVRPIQGADQLALLFPCSELPEIDTFWHLADQWEWIQQRPALEREIIEAARHLLAHLEG